MAKTKPVNSSLLKKENTRIQFDFFLWVGIILVVWKSFEIKAGVGGNNLAPEDSALWPIAAEHTFWACFSISNGSLELLAWAITLAPWTCVNFEKCSVDLQGH